MAQPTFSQSERPNLAIPLAIAVIVLAGAAALIVHFIPKQSADLAITHTATWQAHTVFKTDTILVGRDKAEDNLYVLTTLRLEDRLHVPLFLKDFNATLTTADGQTLTASAVEKTDLPNLYTTFPALKPLSTTPLLRETAIAPGLSAEGMLILRFSATQAEWDHRQSAELTVDFYHQPPQSIPIPRP